MKVAVVGEESVTFAASDIRVDSVVGAVDARRKRLKLDFSLQSAPEKPSLQKHVTSVVHT